MNQIKPITIVTMFLIATLMSGCEIIGGIFKTGMGVGIFMVIAILLVIVFLVMKARKK